ncbi:MAG: glycosyltransferase family 39 protein [Candidatus Schekmanbacteria bacterium]|nr:glycosyltransferase family 39 protein [Candidatus Schekmanbacteria bacterium]
MMSLNNNSEISSPKRGAALFAILAVSAFFSFYRLGLVEFVEGDEAVVMNKIVRFLNWGTDYRNLAAFLTAEHPPMRFLVSLPFVYLFGASEFWLRFPHALSGILSVYWVYRIGKIAFNTYSGLIAALVFAVSGMSAVYRSANGIGVFTLFLLIALECLFRFELAVTEETEKKWLNYTFLFLGLASITFLEGVLFAIPAVYYAYRKKIKVRGIIRASLPFIILSTGYLFLWVILPGIAGYFGLIPSYLAGNTTHVGGRLNNLFAFNLSEFAGAVIATNSLPVIILFLSVFIFQKNLICERLRLPVFYFLPHFIAWFFLFKKPCGHGAYIAPLFALVIGGGVVFWNSDTASVMKKTVLNLMLAIVVVLTGWHNYILNLQDEITPSIRNFVYYDESYMNYPAGAPNFNFEGKAAAGVYVREHVKPTDRVLTDFGYNMELYYAGLLHTSEELDEIAPHLADRDLMQSSGIHYLLLKYPSKYQYAGTHIPAAIVFVRSKATIYIYDLWKEPENTVRLQAEDERNKFYEKYAVWNKIRPVAANVQLRKE